MASGVERGSEGTHIEVSLFTVWGGQWKCQQQAGYEKVRIPDVSFLVFRYALHAVLHWPLAVQPV